jgi:5-methylcytosine-specific restriction endonuclease McrA
MCGHNVSDAKILAVKTRDGFKCVYCGSTKNLSVDHLRPTHRGGSHSIRNLVTACISCNSRKNGRTFGEYLAWLKSQDIDIVMLKWYVVKARRRVVRYPHGRRVS